MKEPKEDGQKLTAGVKTSTKGRLVTTRVRRLEGKEENEMEGAHYGRREGRKKKKEGKQESRRHETDKVVFKYQILSREKRAGGSQRRGEREKCN